MGAGESIVLVVAGARQERAILEQLLSSLPVVTYIVDTGARALERAEKSEIAVVLMDLRLSDADGLELLPRLRSFCPSARFILLAHEADSERVIAGLRSGVFDYLGVPIHEEEALFSVRRAVEAWRVLQTRQSLRDRLSRIVRDCEELSAPSEQDGSHETDSDLIQQGVSLAADLLGAERASLLLVSETQEGESLRIRAAVGMSEPSRELAISLNLEAAEY